MKRIIAVLNQKGGVGKTTTALNLSAYLAKMGLKVLLIDLDPQANATSGLGIDKNGLKTSVYQALLEGLSLKEIIHKTDIDGLDILPSNSDLSGAEVQLANSEGRELKLKTILNDQEPGYDLIIIDCPPSLGLLTVNALAAATDMIIPVQSEYYAMEGLSQLLQIVQRVQQGINPTLQLLGVVLTMYDSRTSLSQQVHNEVSKTFGNLVFKTVIPRNVRLAEAPSYGKPIFLYDKWSKGARTYKSLAKEVKSRVS